MATKLPPPASLAIEHLNVIVPNLLLIELSHFSYWLNIPSFRHGSPELRCQGMQKLSGSYLQKKSVHLAKNGR